MGKHPVSDDDRGNHPFFDPFYGPSHANTTVNKQNMGQSISKMYLNLYVSFSEFILF